MILYRNTISSNIWKCTCEPKIFRLSAAIIFPSAQLSFLARFANLAIYYFNWFLLFLRLKESYRTDWMSALRVAGDCWRRSVRAVLLSGTRSTAIDRSRTRQESCRHPEEARWDSQSARYLIRISCCSFYIQPSSYHFILLWLLLLSYPLSILHFTIPFPIPSFTSIILRLQIPQHFKVFINYCHFSFLKSCKTIYLTIFTF